MALAPTTLLMALLLHASTTVAQTIHTIDEAAAALAAIEAHYSGISPLSDEDLDSAADTVLDAGRTDGDCVECGTENERLRTDIDRLAANLDLTGIKTIALEQAPNFVPGTPTGFMNGGVGIPTHGIGWLILIVQEVLAISSPAEHVPALLDAAAIFPGPLEPEAEALPHALVHIDTTEVSQWRSTGLYAAPGEPITVELPEAAAGQGLFVRIGCSISTLTERASDVQRFPQIDREFDLETTSTLAANAVGGPVCAIPQITTLFAILIYSNSYI